MMGVSRSMPLVVDCEGTVSSAKLGHNCVLWEDWNDLALIVGEERLNIQSRRHVIGKIQHTKGRATILIL